MASTLATAGGRPAGKGHREAAQPRDHRLRACLVRMARPTISSLPAWLEAGDRSRDYRWSCNSTCNPGRIGQSASPPSRRARQRRAGSWLAVEVGRRASDAARRMSRRSGFPENNAEALSMPPALLEPVCLRGRRHRSPSRGPIQMCRRRLCATARLKTTPTI